MFFGQRKSRETRQVSISRAMYGGVSLPEFVAERLARCQEFREAEDFSELIAVFRYLNGPAPDSSQYVAEILNFIDRLYTKHSEIAKAKLQIANDLLHKIRYLDQVWQKHSDLVNGLDDIPSDSKVTRTLLLNLAFRMETFLKFEASFKSTKSCSSWDSQGSNVGKKYYSFLFSFYTHFQEMAHDMTQNNDRAFREIDEARKLLIDSWLELGPNVSKAKYHMLAAANCIGDMGVAMVRFSKVVAV